MKTMLKLIIYSPKYAIKLAIFTLQTVSYCASMTAEILSGICRRFYQFGWNERF